MEQQSFAPFLFEINTFAILKNKHLTIYSNGKN